MSGGSQSIPNNTTTAIVFETINSSSGPAAYFANSGSIIGSTVPAGPDNEWVCPEPEYAGGGYSGGWSATCSVEWDNPLAACYLSTQLTLGGQAAKTSSLHDGVDTNNFYQSTAIQLITNVSPIVEVLVYQNSGAALTVKAGTLLQIAFHGGTW